MVAPTGSSAAHPVEARERQHDAAFGHAAADEPGIAALRHDRDPAPGAGPDHEGDLGGIGRPHHGEGPAR